MNPVEPGIGHRQVSVRNTFLHFSGDSDVEPLVNAGLRTRASSDPQLFAGDPDAYDSCCDDSQTMFVLRGLSDDEGEGTDMEEMATRMGLGCYSHLPDPDEGPPERRETSSKSSATAPGLIHPVFKVLEESCKTPPPIAVESPASDRLEPPDAEHSSPASTAAATTRAASRSQSKNTPASVSVTATTSASSSAHAASSSGGPVLNPVAQRSSGPIKNRKLQKPQVSRCSRRVDVGSQPVSESSLPPKPQPVLVSLASALEAPDSVPIPQATAASSSKFHSEAYDADTDHACRLRGAKPPRTRMNNEFARLASENARLAEENEKLRQHCLSATAAACSMAMSTASTAAAVSGMASASVADSQASATAASQSSASPQPQLLFCGVPWLMCNPGLQHPGGDSKQAQNHYQEQPQSCLPAKHREPMQLNLDISTQPPQEVFQTAQQPLHQLRQGPHCSDKQHRHKRRPQQSQAQQQHVQQEADDLDDASCTEDDSAMPPSGPATMPNDQRTTVMLRNLPNNYTRAMLTAMLNCEGFSGKYDFIYLPMDFGNKACLGYAFINLVSHDLAGRMMQTFSGYSKWIIPSKKSCGVSWSHPHQGLVANIQRYRNSPVMHSAVPNEYKPVIYTKGSVLSFPEPTRKLRAPRIRGQKKPSWA